MQCNLLLDHITATFGATFGMLWFSGANLLHTRFPGIGPLQLDSASVTDFLTGHYCRFINSGESRSPVIVDTRVAAPELPDDLLVVAKTHNISALILLPITSQQKVKGTLALGVNHPESMSDVSYALLEILTSSALNLHDDGHPLSCLPESQGHPARFDRIIGASPPMQRIYDLMAKIAPSDANVLIHGESGTGKELVARAIHALSARSHHAFIPVDCVALPGSLLESELFGHEEGAFTGANGVKRGLIEHADKGTFFLDEITEMDIDLQAKLLRALQERQFRRVGGQDLLNADIRVVSTTNRDPQASVEQGFLRDDLFYRLNVLPICIPPLRERVEDIPLLIAHFLGKSVKAREANNIKFTREAMRSLARYRWPGNVRELRNVVERTVALATHETIDLADLPEDIRNAPSRLDASGSDYALDLPYMEAKQQTLNQFETTYFSRLLAKFHGNVSRIAREARVSRKTIYTVLDKNGISINRRSEITC